GISLSSTGGKVVLMTNNTPLPSGPCAFTTAAVDLVGYGSEPFCFEGPSGAPAPTTTNADRRNGDGCIDSNNNGADFSLGSPSPRNRSSAVTSCSSTIQLSSGAYSVNEGTQRVDITVTRSGDTSAAASVAFGTIDDAGLQECKTINGIASPRCDYIYTLGTLTWTAGDATSKSFSVAIVDDSYAEGNETFRVSLSNPSGATLGTPSIATVTITDNETVNGPNPIDNTNFFVRQQYIDFLGREPDSFGFNAWVNTINNCSGYTIPF